MPTADALTLDGLEICRRTIEDLLRVNPDDWTTELRETSKFFARFGSRLPEELQEEHRQLSQRFERILAARK